MKKAYRTLLPWSGAARRTNVQASNRVEKQPRSKKRRSVACERCRTRKVACDGLRLNCTGCDEAKAPCSYRCLESCQSMELQLRNELQQVRVALTQHEHILAQLQSGTDSNALSVIQQLRLAPNISTVLSAIETDAAAALELPGAEESHVTSSDLTPNIHMHLSAFTQPEYALLSYMDTGSSSFEELFSSPCPSPHSSRPPESISGASPDSAAECTQPAALASPAAHENQSRYVLPCLEPIVAFPSA